jgi:hypothetical protein
MPPPGYGVVERCSRRAVARSKSLDSALLLVVLVGCGKSHSSAATAASTSPTPIASAPPSDSSVGNTEPTRERFVVATFAKDVLAECDEVTLEGSIPPEKIAAIRAKLAADKNTQELSKSCTDQFSDRLVLAGCVASQRNDAGDASIVVASYYYIVESLLNDGAMRECLKSKGEWHAVPRDSREWRRARVEADQRKLEKLSGQVSP